MRTDNATMNREIRESARRIKMGDRVFARLTMHGRVIMEFTTTLVADMTELLGELRHRLAGVQGLTRLYVRNMSRGWSSERPLMLYSGNARGRGGILSGAATPSGRPHTPFPWEADWL